LGLRCGIYVDNVRLLLLVLVLLLLLLLLQGLQHANMK
jgi:hypothetical protein